MARAYPINSSSAAVTVPGVNDYDLNRVPTEFFEEGVVRGFAVTERGAGANMSVDVAAGLAVIEITNTNVDHGKTYKTWFEETITTNLAITTADATNPRKDRVVLRIDVSTDPNVSTSNIAIIEVIAGTPAGSPSAPSEPSNAITLAIVDVPASDTTISTAQITDSRTYVTLDTSVLADIARLADLASTSNGDGASLIGIEDSGGNYTATTVEGALTEIDTRIVDALTTLNTGLYGDGSDGAKTVSASENLNPATEFEYTTLQIDSGQTLGVTSSNTPLVIKVSGNATINGTIDLDGKGGPGGAAQTDTGSGNSGTAGNSKVTGWTVAGGAGGDTANGNGGKGLSVFTSSLTAAQLAKLSQIMRNAVCGSGGGSGGTNDAQDSGEGGNGGGALMLFVGGDLTLGASSVITADGLAGAAGVGDAGDGSGGGGGDVIVLVGGSITDNGVTLSATGGAAGGSATAGDAGKVIIFSLSTGTILTA